MNTVFVSIDSKKKVVGFGSKIYYVSDASVKRIFSLMGLEKGRPIAHANGNVTTYVVNK